jgi:hypothetical protein
MAVIVLEEASLGRPDAKARAHSGLVAIPESERKGQTRMGFGPHANKTYATVLRNHKKYIEQNFGRYRFVQKDQQDITITYIQQRLEFVPVSSNKPGKKSHQTGQSNTPTGMSFGMSMEDYALQKKEQAFVKWLQSPEAGHLYEDYEHERNEKSYDSTTRHVHDTVGAALVCTIL